MWGQKDTLSGETCAATDFQQAAYELLYDCMRRDLELAQAKTRNVKQQSRMNGNAMRFDMIGQLPLEIIGWLRDAFHLEQQVVTSALTLNCLFAVAPTMLGTLWGDSPVGSHWRVSVDDFFAAKTGPVALWSHRCLLVLNEPRDGALSRVWEKINATARLRQVVVIIHEIPGGKRLSWTHYRRYTTNEVTCTGLDIFPAGTVRFGHAAGWNDYADRNETSDTQI